MQGEASEDPRWADGDGYMPLVPKLYPATATTPSSTGGKDAADSLQAEERRLTQLLGALQKREREVLAGLRGMEELFKTRAKPLRFELESVRKQAAREALLLEQLQSKLTGESPPPGPASLRWVGGDLFGLACMCVILCNLVTMFVEISSLGGKVEFWVLDQVFLAWYILEIALKVVLFQKSFLFGPVTADRAFAWLDLLIVASGVVDQWCLPALTQSGLMGQSNTSGLPFKTASLRALRMLRVTRMFRLLKAINLLLHMDLSWADGRRFESFIMGVILVNAVSMGLELDFDWACFHWLNLVMLLIYIFEICVRIKHHRWRFFTHESNVLWNYLDIGIVVGGMVEQFGLPAYDAVSMLVWGQSSHRDPHGGVLSMLRIFRLMRIARLYRLLTMFKALRQLVLGIADAMQGTIWVILLTFIVLYIFAILFTTLVGRGIVFNGDPPPAALSTFGSVEMSLYTLFKLMNDDQSVVQFTNCVWVKLLFMLSMVVLNWVMLATLTSVVTDHMHSSTSRHERIEEDRQNELRRSQCQARLKFLFKEMDKDGNGFVVRDEFEALLKNPALREELLEASGLAAPRDLMELFEYLSHDIDSGQRAILYEDFIEKMQTESRPASERIIYRLEEELRSSELRNERRFQNLIRLLQDPPELRASLSYQRDLQVRRPIPTLPPWSCMKFGEEPDIDNQMETMTRTDALAEEGGENA